MKKMELDWYKILHHFTLGVNILFVFLLLFNWLSYLPEFWNITYIFYFVVFVNVIFFVFNVNKIPENKKKDNKMIYYFSHSFLLLLVVITLNQFVRRPFIINFMSEINALTLGMGFLFFYTYRDKIEKEKEKEKAMEKKAEKERFKEFENKFPKLNRIPVLRRFVKWMYKEGWIYCFGLIIIMLMGFFLRVWNLNYLQGSDNYNLIAAQSFFQNGKFLYSRSPHITITLGFLFKFFGRNLIIARIPFIFISLLSLILIYLLGKLINKKVGILASFLFAISPFSIGISTFIRNYAELFFWNLLFSFILLKIYFKEKNNPEGYKKYLGWFFTLSIFIYLYSKLLNEGTFKSTLLTMLILTIYISYDYIKINHKKLIKYYYLFFLLFVICFLKFGHVFWTLLSSGFTYNPIWFKQFFNPLIKFPMQWFSSSIASPILFLFLFLLPLIFSIKKYSVFYVLFFVNLFMFIFKYAGSYSHAIYLYYIYPFYILIFALGIFYLLRSIGSINKKISIFLIVLFLFSSFIIPSNSFAAAKSELSINYPNFDNYQPAASSNRDYYYEIFGILDKIEISNKDAILLEGEHPYYFVWEYNYLINRSYKLKSGSVYETGDKVYWISEENEIDESDLAINNHPEGYAILYGKNSLELAKRENFLLIDEYLQWKIYKWGDF
jgi:hypothetical protein